MSIPGAGGHNPRGATKIAALWFVGALLSGTITTALLIASGWRPYRLPAFAAAIWVTGTVIASAGTILLAWAGSPDSDDGAGRQARRKALVLRVGIAAFLAGTAVASMVELSSPLEATR